MSHRAIKYLANTFGPCYFQTSYFWLKPIFLFHLLSATYFKVGHFTFFSVSNWLFVFLDCYLEFNLKDWDNKIRLVKTQPACYVAQNRCTCVTYFSRRHSDFFCLMLVSCWSVQLSNFTGAAKLNFILQIYFHYLNDIVNFWIFS